MEGGLPLVTMSTVFQPSISLYFHLPRTSFQYAVNLVVQLYQPTHMLLHERVLLYAVNLELQLLFTCIILERVFLSPSIRIIKCFITYHYSRTSVSYAVNQNLQSLFAPSMPNMTPSSTSEGPKRSFIFHFIAILRIS